MEEEEATAEQSAKIVPPLRLKKVGSELMPANAPDDQASSKYRIVSSRQEANNTDNSNSNANKVAESIEIMIPSVPELGIKETRTDRISVPAQDTDRPKPFVFNYLLGQDT